MTKLEQANKEIDEKYSSNRKFKPAMTINEKAMADVAKKLSWMSHEKHEEEQRHLLALKRIERKQRTFHYAAIILSGQTGFLRCSQGWADLRSGFTCLQEITNRLPDPMVDVSLEKMNCGFGMELWTIDDRGMMTLVSAERDSSD